MGFFNKSASAKPSKQLKDVNINAPVSAPKNKKNKKAAVNFLITVSKSFPIRFKYR